MDRDSLRHVPIDLQRARQNLRLRQKNQIFYDRERRVLVSVKLDQSLSYEEWEADQARLSLLANRLAAAARVPQEEAFLMLAHWSNGGDPFETQSSFERLVEGLIRFFSSEEGR